MVVSNVPNFGINVSDSTITILPGVARVGNSLMPFNGAQTTFNQILSAGDSSQWINILLYLSNAGGLPYIASVASTRVPNKVDLVFPSLPADSTEAYAPGFPLSLFTFYSADGTNGQLESYTPL